MGYILSEKFKHFLKLGIVLKLNLIFKIDKDKYAILRTA